MSATEEKLKHLDFVQGIVNRMAQNSFILKGWAITLVSGLMALAAAQSDKRYVLITYFCVPLIWLLDRYYLHQERVFRALFHSISEGKIDNFKMGTSDFNVGRCRWLPSCFGHTVFPIYGVIFIVIFIIMFEF